MMMKIVVPVALAAALAGCGSIGAIGLPPMDRNTPESVDSVAVSPVESSNLPPVDGAAPSSTTGVVGASGNPAGTAPGAVPGVTPATNTASLNAPPPASASALGRTDLLGGWTVASAGDTCQLFMTLTSWTGGYRASTRGCNSDVLKSISAWNLTGSQVVLAGTGGSSVATLNSSGSGRFDGQTNQGTQIIFYR